MCRSTDFEIERAEPHVVHCQGQTYGPLEDLCNPEQFRKAKARIDDILARLSSAPIDSRYFLYQSFSALVL